MILIQPLSNFTLQFIMIAAIGIIALIVALLLPRRKMKYDDIMGIKSIQIQNEFDAYFYKLSCQIKCNHLEFKIS